MRRRPRSCSRISDRSLSLVTATSGTVLATADDRGDWAACKAEGRRSRSNPIALTTGRGVMRILIFPFVRTDVFEISLCNITFEQGTWLTTISRTGPDGAFHVKCDGLR
jgi:hypothetical protein